MRGHLSACPVTGVSQVPGPGSNQSSTGGPDSCMQQMHGSVSRGSTPAHCAFAPRCSQGIMKFVVVWPKASQRYLPFSLFHFHLLIGLGTFGLGVFGSMTKVHNGSGRGH